MAPSTASEHALRKDEHLALAAGSYGRAADNSFDEVRIIHRSLPELAVRDVNIATHFGDIALDVPFYIEAMTGGSEKTTEINRSLARAAAATGLAMAVGSQAIAINHPERSSLFSAVREQNPDGVLFANVGAGCTVDEARRAIDMVNADALEVHVNTVQEIVMPEGDRDFHWLTSIERLVPALGVPVIVKEVGMGMCRETVEQLAGVGVSYLNISGRGGTNFAFIENERRPGRDLDYLALWGQRTVESLLEVQGSGCHVAASGGVRTPLDVFKALMLGAEAVGVAGHFLHILMDRGEQALIEVLEDWKQSLGALYTLTGCRSSADVHSVPHVLSQELISYASQRSLIRV